MHFLSGLLTGLELRELKSQNIDQFILVGGDKLQPYYATALGKLNLGERAICLRRRKLKI